MSVTEARAVEIVNARVISYFCAGCKQSISLLPELRKKVEGLEHELKAVRSQVELTQKAEGNRDKMSRKVKELEERISAVERTSRVDEVVSKQKDIQERVEKMEVEIVGRVEGGDSDQSVKFASVIPAVSEMQEREKRKRNVLLFGVRESELKSAQERKTDEKERVKGIIRDLNAGVSLENIQVFRLGKYAGDRVRPIKVVFESGDYALAVLKGRSSIKEDGVYIKSDQTPLQRQHLSELVATLNRRRDDGEADLTIKYIGGIPKIIKKRLPKNQ